MQTFIRYTDAHQRHQLIVEGLIPSPPPLSSPSASNLLFSNKLGRLDTLEALVDSNTWLQIPGFEYLASSRTHEHLNT